MALSAFEKAEAGEADAQFLVGMWYLNGSERFNIPIDHEQAFKWFRLAAEQGHTFAQCNIGVMCAEGLGVPKDSSEAVNWYRKGAERGLHNAQHNLAFMYEQGDGVTKDSAEAAKWYLLAAEQGYGMAQGNLGCMYWRGEGVPKDFVQAHAWINIAASKGVDVWKTTLQVIENEMTFEQKAEAMTVARLFFAKLPKEPKT